MTRTTVRIACCLLCLLLTLPSGFAHAWVTYKTNYYDDNANRIRIQPVYVPAGILPQRFVEPVDLFVAENDHVFVVDKGSSTVIEFSGDNKPVRSFGDQEGEGSLSEPEGVFVDQEGTVYVADTGNERIAVFNEAGSFVRAYGKPESPALTSDFYFVPTKLAVDSRGVMYIACKGAELGLVRMSPDGEFRGFFGVNKANASYLGWVKKLILTKEQLAKEVANKPRPVANVTLDPSDFIVTVSPGLNTTGNIRKLNAGGIDMMPAELLINTGSVADAAVDRNDFVYGVDQENSKISIYNPQGDIVFDFAGKQMSAQWDGLLVFPTAIGVNSRFEVLVSDGGTGIVQLYKRSEFGNAALTVSYLYDQGRYEESRPYFAQIAVQNEMFDLTYHGLGKLALQDGDYENALELFKEAKNTKDYSVAFWNVRIDRIEAYFVPVFFTLLILFVLYRLLRSRLAARLQTVSWPEGLRLYGSEMKAFFLILFKPYDGYYRLKDRKVGLLVIVTILLLAALARVVTVYGSGFLYNPVELRSINIWYQLWLPFLPWITWVIASYLVCSIKGGEGRFREVVQASTFGLAPYILFAIVIVPLTNVTVLEESILVQAATQLMLLMTVIHFFVMSQVIHNFDFLETAKNLLISIFTALLIWFFAAIIGALTFNLYEFFYELYREVR
ncbi:YIP1 family protein [Paenibacillus eucommiae]|uniref:DNA-binding beta-propeller fold protein YncE n=1 Tax=Paenibacillus eucommiae TaxID=1355755 RepID=A0ABS4J3C8_9BACL|nr:YIP1 family protein [Paenibacillus eucommiae]MBP1993611.1 DNA-binding beta-propeller fold protein YncE [Paenibacillus eucommiae]